VGENLPAVKLKGIEGDVVIINVRKMRRGSRLQPPERPLLGREVEQHRLAGALAALQKGRGDAWLVSGETGIGKTSLVADLAAGARRQGVTVLAGRCQPHSKYMPLFPWLDVLAAWLDLDETPDCHQQRAQLAAKLSALGMSASQAALADLLALSPVESPPAAKSPKPKPDPAEQAAPSMFTRLTRQVADEPVAPVAAGGLSALLQQRLAEQDCGGDNESSVWQTLAERVSGPRIIGQVLTRLAGCEPLLLIIEDIHWLDAESAALLTDLLAEIDNVPLLLVLTGRTGWEHERISPLVLPPLANKAIAEIAARTLAGSWLDDTLAVWIYDRAAGNPLYAQTLCRGLQQDDAVLLDRDTGEIRWTRMVPALPVSLHELLLARLEALPLLEQDVLRRAAVIGTVFDYEGLFYLCRLQACATEVAAALENTVQCSLINQMGDTTYRFTHALMQETIYETLSFAQRRQWHTQLADCLLLWQPAGAMEIVTYHYLRGEDAVKAAQFGCRAGDKARQRDVWVGALEYYQQVLALADAPALWKKYAAESRADVLALQGDYRAATAAYTEAVKAGCAGAMGKKLLFSGDVAPLLEAEFEPAIRPWAAGARAWLLAQAGQIQAARQIVGEALSVVAHEDVAQPALAGLAQKLAGQQQTVGDYREWLDLFVAGMLRET
jgi:predicted ATPase